MRNFQILLLLAAFLSSCGQYKRFTYIQPSAATMNDTVFIKDFSQYKLQPADILKVDVLSIDKNVTEMFNKDASSTGSTGGAGGTYYLMGYSVDPEGYINLPVLGKLQVAGLTVTEARSLIQTKATEYLKDAQIEVKLLSFKIYFLGEVKSPGQQTVFSDRANILEAVALAGDLTYNGNRKNVSILRSEQNRTRLIEVDLTQRDILTSPQYYLQPNDVVYVKPLKSTIFRIRLSEYAGILSFFTSTVTLAVLIVNLSK
jgi:polysaccharide export outer membrane protein